MKNRTLVLNSFVVLLTLLLIDYSLAGIVHNDLRTATTADIQTLYSEDSEFHKAKKSEGQIHYNEQLNAEFQSLSIAQADKLNLIGGAKLARLSEGVLREQTNVQEGFIITKVNGKAIYSTEHLFAELAKAESTVVLEGIYDDLLGEYDDFPGVFSYSIMINHQL